MMSMQQTPGPSEQPPARMSQGRLIVTIAAGIVLAAVALAFLPVLLLALGFVVHIFLALFFPILLVLGIAAVVLLVLRARRGRL
jgi:fatty acid desaturase